MVRLCCLAFPARQGARSVLGTVYTTYHLEVLRTCASDRVANEDAFPAEFVVRLPRGLSRRLAAAGALHQMPLREIMDRVEPQTVREDPRPDTVPAQITPQESWMTLVEEFSQTADGSLSWAERFDVRRRELLPLLLESGHTHGTSDGSWISCGSIPREWERIEVLPNTTTA